MVTFVVYSLVEDYNRNSMDKIIICQSINLVIVVLNMVVGSRSITFSKKLKNVDWLNLNLPSSTDIYFLFYVLILLYKIGK